MQTCETFIITFRDGSWTTITAKDQSDAVHWCHVNGWTAANIASVMRT